MANTSGSTSASFRIKSTFCSRRRSRDTHPERHIRDTRSLGLVRRVTVPGERAFPSLFNVRQCRCGGRGDRSRPTLGPAASSSVCETAVCVPCGSGRVWGGASAGERRPTYVQGRGDAFNVQPPRGVKDVVGRAVLQQQLALAVAELRKVALE